MKEYFSHDYHARGDENIIRLLRDDGWEGYGIYWAIVEMLYEGGGSIPQDYDLLAYDMRTQCERIKKVCEDYALFYFRDNRICSESVDRRMAERENRSISARGSAMKRWNNNANAMRTQCDGNAIKESKEKERTNMPDKSGEFAQFWKAYPKKTGKKQAIKAWSKLNPPLDKCLLTLKWQVVNPDWIKENGQFIPYPATWLNAGQWDDVPDTHHLVECSVCGIEGILPKSIQGKPICKSCKEKSNVN